MISHTLRSARGPMVHTDANTHDRLYVVYDIVCFSRSMRSLTIVTMVLCVVTPRWRPDYKTPDRLMSGTIQCASCGQCGHQQVL